MSLTITKALADAVDAKLAKAGEIKLDENGEVVIAKKGGSISVAREITRNLKFSDVFEADKIRDLSELIAMKYTKPELWLPNSLEDYTELYSKGNAVPSYGSCMTNPPGAVHGMVYTPAICQEMLDKHKVWSSIFYYYIPQLQFAVLRHRGKKICRTVIVNGKYSDNWYYGDRGAELLQLLDNNGYPRVDYITDKMFTEKFTIPAYDSSVGPLCPLPHADFGHGYFMAYCKGTNTFYFAKECKWTYALHGHLHQWREANSITQLEKAPW